jgi:hypothetical protein
MRNPLVLLAAFACASCAAGPSPSYPATAEARLALYAETTPCCDDPSGFPFKTLPPRGFTDAAVDKSSPVFDFHSGLSPFVAFELPRQAASYRVRIKSVFDEKNGGKDGVFYPVVALLDETFIVVQMTGIDNLRLEPSLATPGGAPGLSVSLAIDPAEQKGKYLVVFTPAVLLGAPPDARREGDLLTPSTLAWLERRGETVVPPSPYGNLKITVAPDQPLASAGSPAHTRSP